MKRITYLLLLLGLFASCSTSKELRKFAGNDITFGSGGGFANQMTTYILKYDGSLLQQKRMSNEAALIGKISPRKAKAFFKDFLAHGLDTLQFSDPGNMYYFIGFRNDSTQQKITWGGSKTPPDYPKEFYQSLMKLVNNQ